MRKANFCFLSLDEILWRKWEEEVCCLKLKFNFFPFLFIIFYSIDETESVKI
jgi:hypothetical protein